MIVVIQCKFLVIKSINEICVDILFHDFEMKEFLDFELLLLEFLWILKLLYSYPMHWLPPITTGKSGSNASEISHEAEFQ